MEFYKNLKPIHLYLCSIVFIVLSNVVREKNQSIYLIFYRSIFQLWGVLSTPIDVIKLMQMKRTFI